MKITIKTISIAFALCHSILGHGDTPSDFENWLRTDLKPLAQAQGVSNDTLNRAFKDGSTASPSIIFNTGAGLQSTPYAEKRLPPNALVARTKAQQHKRVLESVQKKYGVPTEMILALWGLESNFGTNIGQCLTIQALAKQAFGSERRKFFTQELIEALKILQDQNMDVHHLKGSWDGALGQCQFMPSTFRKYAVDFRGKGHKDIWGSEEDVFASIANYLAHSGWKKDEPWGIEVIIPSRLNKKGLSNLSIKHPKEYWMKLGIKPANREYTLPNLIGALIIDRTGKAFIVYNNFLVVLKWNRSILFALAVCQFSDQIREHKFRTYK